MVWELEGSLIPILCRNALLPCLLGSHLLLAHEIKKEIRLMIEAISLKRPLSGSVGDKNKLQSTPKLKKKGSEGPFLGFFEKVVDLGGQSLGFGRWHLMELESVTWQGLALSFSTKHWHCWHSFGLLHRYHLHVSRHTMQWLFQGQWQLAGGAHGGVTILRLPCYSGDKNDQRCTWVKEVWLAFLIGCSLIIQVGEVLPRGAKVF